MASSFGFLFHPVTELTNLFSDVSIQLKLLQDKFNAAQRVKVLFFSLLIALVKILYSDSHCSMATNMQMQRILDV